MLAEAESVLAEQAKIAEITEAYEAKDYEKVTELASGFETADETVTTMLAEAESVLAEQARQEQIDAAYADKDFAQVLELFANDVERMTDERYIESVREVSRQTILATGDQKYIQMPAEESYLSEPRTMYITSLPYDWCTLDKTGDPDQMKACGPGVSVERVPEARSGRLTMPWAYEGTEVMVVAEENGMSCIVYRYSDNRMRAGWVQTRFLVDEFPGKQLEIGSPTSANITTVNGIEMQWSRKSFLTTQQNYSVLSETVENCVGFTLEYQLIQENTPIWGNILGPRDVYVNDGTQWIKVGSFAYPEFGTVRVAVHLNQPTNIVAIGTIADCAWPDIFFFRQFAEDFAVID